MLTKGRHRLCDDQYHRPDARGVCPICTLQHRLDANEDDVSGNVVVFFVGLAGAAAWIVGAGLIVALVWTAAKWWLAVFP